MSTQDHHAAHGHEPRGWRSTRTLIVVGFFIIAGLLLFSEHRAHLFGALIWLLPFACILLHSFMHGGHGHSHGHRRREDASGDAAPKSSGEGEAS